MQEHKKTKRTQFLKSGIWNLKSIFAKRTHFCRKPRTKNKELFTKNPFFYEKHSLTNLPRSVRLWQVDINKTIKIFFGGHS